MKTTENKRMSLRNSKTKKPNPINISLTTVKKRNCLLIMQLMNNDEANQKLSLERKNIVVEVGNCKQIQ